MKFKIEKWVACLCCFVLLGLLAGCQLFEESVSPAIESIPTPQPEVVLEEGDVGLVRVDTDVWCSQDVIVLKKSGSYTRTNYRGTFATEEEKGNYTQANGRLIFSDRQVKMSSDSVFRASSESKEFVVL